MKLSGFCRRIGLVSLFVAALMMTEFRLWPERSVAAQRSDNSQAIQARFSQSFGRLPVRFEASQGQTDPRVRYMARGSGYSLFLTDDEAIMRLQNADCRMQTDPARLPLGNNSSQSAICNPHSAIVRMKLAGARPQPRISGLDPLISRSHYLTGSDSRQWRTEVSNFARVKYEAVWPGIDLIWYGNEQQLEHDFIVAPGANPGRIRLAFSGVSSLKVAADGALLLETEGGTLRLLRPVAWQEADGVRREIACAYRPGKNNQVEFALGSYDRRRPLIIDPVLIWSTYFGGAGQENGTAIAVDKNGGVYVTGTTQSTDFPLKNPFQSSLASAQQSDAFILKLSPNGQQVIWSTYLGGNSFDSPTSINVDDAGNVYLSGDTYSDNFPVTAGALQTALKGVNDGFVTKLNPAGSALVYSTYLGGRGSDFATSMAVDSGGSVYLSGSTDSTDLPATGIQTAKIGSAAYKSTNAGSSWTAIGAGLSGIQTTWLAVDPVSANTLYAATFAGIFKSTDGGSNWIRPGVINSAIIQQTNVIAIDPSSPMTLYAGAFGGVWKSTDSGAIWVNKSNGIIFNGAPFIYTIHIDPQAPATLYAGGEGGVFRSTNGGENWTAINNGLIVPFTNNRIVVRRLIGAASGPATLYAGTDRGVFKTTDGGANWSPINTGLPNSSGLPGGGPDTRALVADPSAPATLYLASNFTSSGTVFKSVDGGANWTRSDNGLSLTINGNVIPLSVNALAVSTVSPATVYAATNSGIYRSTDGGANWTQSNTGLADLRITALAVDRAPSGAVYAGTFIRTDSWAAKLNAAGSGVTWLTYLGGSGSDAATGIALDKDGNAYVGGGTDSSNFPTSSPFQASFGGSSDAFVTKINASGTALVWSSYLGGLSFDYAFRLAVSNAGEAYLTGYTQSNNFPTLNPLQAVFNGGSGSSPDVFVTKIKADGSGLVWSTYLGGERTDLGYALALDAPGNVYITGQTDSVRFPVADAPQSQLNKGQTNTGASDAFVAKINASGTMLVYSTFLGGAGVEQGAGVAVDSVGNAYVTGYTSSLDFPVSRAVQPELVVANFVAQDAFITKLGIEADPAISSAVSRNPVMVSNNLTLVLTAVNRGPSPATGVTVTHQLPAGVNFVSASASQGACANSSGTVTCNLGSLAVNASAMASIIITPTATGSLSLTGRVSATEADGDAGNNETTQTVTVSNQPSVAGRVTLAGGAGLANVNVSLQGAQTAQAQTDSSGFYQIASLTPGGSYALTPARDGFSFEPPTRSFASITGDLTADFTATPCGYTISPAQQGFERAGGAGSLTVTGTPRCPWTAVSHADWITITSGASGSGNGAVNFNVAPTTVPRSARLTVAGQTFVVWQGLGACSAPGYRKTTYPIAGQAFDSVLPPAAITDFNGDGKSDVVLIGRLTIAPNLPPPFPPAERPILVYLGDGSGGFTARELRRVNYLASGLAVGDFNGDGRTDVAVFIPTKIQVFLNDGNGGLSDPTEYSAPNLAVLTPIEVNGDGRTDLLYRVEGGVQLLLSRSQGGFGAPVGITLDAATIISLSDLNGDGLTDIVTYKSGFNQSELRAYLADGVGSFRAPVISQVTSSVQAGVVGDLNGDGKADLVVSQSNNQAERNLITLSGDGAGRFNSPRSFSFGTGQSLIPYVADFNGDARPDVVLTLQFGNGIAQLLPGDGAGGIGAPVSLLSSQLPQNILFGQLNGDDITDLVVIENIQSGADLPILTAYVNRCGASGLAIFGRVTDGASLLGVGNVTVKLSGAQTASVTTDNDGNYQLSGLSAGGSYTVTAERGGFDFAPASQTFSNLTTDQTLNITGNRKAVPVSATSYNGQVIAPESIVAVFGVEMTTDTATATSLPLPTQLGQTSATLLDSAGAERPVRLFFVSPGQINLLIPPGVATGTATLKIMQGFGPGQSRVSTGTFQVAAVAPGIFSADASGQGLAAALVFRIKADGTQLFEPVARYDTTQQKFVSVPIDLSNQAEQVFLILYGSGLRGRSALSAVTARIGSADAEFLFAGAHPDFAGLDQINLRLSNRQQGSGEVNVTLTVDGKTTNAVRVNFN